jgi:hypothetical protein
MVEGVWLGVGERLVNSFKLASADWLADPLTLADGVMLDDAVWLAGYRENLVE